MASAWGSSWGSAWGNAWGLISSLVIIDTHDGQESKKVAERFKRKKEELHAQLAAAFNKTFGIVEPVEKIAQEVAAVEQQITKAMNEKDMAAIAEKVTRIVTEIRDREEQDDEEAILLLAI